MKKQKQLKPIISIFEVENDPKVKKGEAKIFVHFHEEFDHIDLCVYMMSAVRKFLSEFPENNEACEFEIKKILDKLFVDADGILTKTNL